MSTAVETIAARHMDMRVVCINCVTNMASGIGEDEFDSLEVINAAKEMEDNYVVLLKRLVAEMDMETAGD